MGNHCNLMIIQESRFASSVQYGIALSLHKDACRRSCAGDAHIGFAGQQSTQSEKQRECAPDHEFCCKRNQKRLNSKLYVTVRNGKSHRGTAW